MSRTIIELHYNGDIHFDIENLPAGISADVYLGLYEKLYTQMMDDFFEFETSQDRLEVSYSVLTDLHRLIDVYQLRRSELPSSLSDLNIEVNEFRAIMEIDENNEISINFLGEVGAQEIVVGLAILAGETLNVVDVNTMLVALIFDVTPPESEDVVN